MVDDYNNKSFNIIDIEEYKLSSDINGQHTDKVVNIKKIYIIHFIENLYSGLKEIKV